MISTSDSELTRDGFLGGRVQVRQPRKGYRAGTDPVLLAAAIPAKTGESVLELGCGAGTAVLCLAARVPGLRLTGVEVQGDYAALARRNAAENGADLEVVKADLRDLPAELRQRCFDHVLMNPPYFDRRRGTAAADGGRDLALAGETPLADWLTAGSRRLAPGGTLTAICRAERLPELFRHLPESLGGARVLPLAARTGREADRVLLQAIKGARAQFRLLAPLILHSGAAHQGDGDDYSATASAILRDAAALPWTD